MAFFPQIFPNPNRLQLQTSHIISSHPNYPVIWKILGLFSSPIRREIDHP